MLQFGGRGRGALCRHLNNTAFYFSDSRGSDTGSHQLHWARGGEGGRGRGRGVRGWGGKAVTGETILSYFDQACFALTTVLSVCLTSCANICSSLKTHHE